MSVINVVTIDRDWCFKHGCNQTHESAKTYMKHIKNYIEQIMILQYIKVCNFIQLNMTSFSKIAVYDNFYINFLP